MVVRTLFLVQKGQTSGCGGCSGIVVCGGGDIVFGAKRPNQWDMYGNHTTLGFCLSSQNSVKVIYKKKLNDILQFKRSAYLFRCCFFADDVKVTKRTNTICGTCSGMAGVSFSNYANTIVSVDDISHALNIDVDSNYL